MITPRIAAITATVTLALCAAHGRGILKPPAPPTTNAPPVVVTNAPPPVTTNAPPPVVVPTTVREVWRGDKSRKVMWAQRVPRGLIVSHYDRNTRVSSKIEERGPNGWKRIWSGDEETIGESPMLGAAPLGDGIVFAAERGKNFLRYDVKTGSMSRLARVPAGYKWNVYAARWKDIVAIGGDGPDTRAAVFDATTGRKLFESPLNGLIAGMCEDNRGVLWLAVSDGEHGVANSERWASRKIKPASVAYHPGLGMIFGSMRDGRIYQLIGEDFREIADLNCSKVNRMIFDASRQGTWIAASNPDTIAFLRAGEPIRIIKRWDDEQKQESGEQFDAHVYPTPDGAVTAARSNKSGTYVYEIVQ